METEEVEQEIIYEEGEETQINVIPVELVDPYEKYITSPHNATYKAKYYKQTYRSAWELMPDFKGWLRGVEGQPNRAYCTYCQKTLHAHRLSLLKHTCTIRHRKAAQLHSKRRQNKGLMEQKVIISDEIVQDSSVADDAEYTEVRIVEEVEQDSEQEAEEEDVEETLEVHQMPTQKTEIIQVPPISTNVIDTSRGTSVSGLQVSLYKLIDGRWTYINEGITNASGKFNHLIERDDFTPGRYKLHYDVDRYFEAKKQDTIYPFIETIFDSSNYSETFNMHLLLNPFGYTTYRG